MPYSLTDLQAIINGGGSVEWQGRVITSLADLPTQAQLDAATGAAVTATVVGTLEKYAFLASGSAAGTLSGYFVDANGAQLTGVVSLAIDNVTPKTFYHVNGGAWPAGAVGFEGQLVGGSLYYNRSGTSGGGVGRNPAAGCPRLDAIPILTFGRVG